MTREASDALEPEAESFIVSDRITKTELRRRLGQQADALRALRPNLDRAQGAVQSALQDNDRLRAQNRELQRQISLQAERLHGTSATSKDLITSLELTDRAERHLQTVLNLASFYMKHT
jgi:chromosome segregation ATPase